MPTGIEEAIAALVAAATSAAGFSAFTAAPDGNLVAQPVTAAAEFGASQCMPGAEDQEGDPQQCLDPGIEGSDQPSAPVTGDRPRLAPPGRKPDIEMEIVITARPPAADAPDRPLPFNPDAAPPPPPTGSPHAGEAGSDATEPERPDTPAASPPDAGFRMPVLADWADQWQSAAPSAPPSSLAATNFGITGEDFNQAAKKEVADLLGQFVDELLAGDPKGQWSDPAFEAAIVGTVADVAIDVASIVVDPPFVIRGIMRLGTGSAQGVDDIEHGRILRGSMKIVGEASSAVLLVVAPIDPAPRTARMTMYGPESLIKPEGTVHNVVKVESAAGDMASHAVKGGSDARPVAIASEYKIPHLEMNIERYTPVSRAIPEGPAARVLRAMDEAHKSSFEGMSGGIGPYGKVQEHCSTYVAMLSTEAGIPITGILGPRLTLVMFKYAPQLANPTFPFIAGGGSANSSSATSNGGP